jgi:pyruvate dehydrogenase E1 component alpha subunit
MAKKTKKYETRFSAEQWRKWYEDMLFWRRIEEKAGMVYTMGKIRGFLHLYIGQEALVAGACAAIRPDDNMITAYRNHIHPLGKGMDPKSMMAELYGKSTGCSKGMGGSMHMFSKEHRFFGGHGIVGGQIPLGAGLAFADKFNGTDRVTLCYMGDGAVRQGAFHETLNLAMLWKLPVIFVIENNMYAMGTSVERTSNVTDLYKLGSAFDMPSFQVDGMKCDTVYDATEEAVARARRGDGPTLLEIRTYRYKGHSMSDPQKYRTKDEVDQFKSEDPILHALHVLQSNDWIKESELEAIDEKVKAMVDECVEFAENSPFPEPEDLWKYVYAQEDYPFIKEY